MLGREGRYRCQSAQGRKEGERERERGREGKEGRREKAMEGGWGEGDKEIKGGRGGQVESKAKVSLP